jgi:hypothetical protein
MRIVVLEMGQAEDGRTNVSVIGEDLADPSFLTYRDVSARRGALLGTMAISRVR